MEKQHFQRHTLFFIFAKKSPEHHYIVTWKLHHEGGEYGRLDI